MKKGIVGILIFLTITMVSCFGYASDEITSVITDGSGLNNNKYNWVGESPLSYIHDNNDGTFTVVDISYNADDFTKLEIYADIYDSLSLKLISSKQITSELDLFGGLYFGEKYNFIVFGQKNYEEDDSKVTIKTVKYSKDWEKLGEANYSNNNTVLPFFFGQVSMCEYNNYLFVYSSHQMYKFWGVNHQANIIYNIDIDTMKIIDEGSSYFFNGFLSHSDNQLIKINNGNVIIIDGCDGSPRAIVMGRYTINPEKGLFTNSSFEKCLLVRLLGSSGGSYLGIDVGGFELSANNYIVAASAIDLDKYYDAISGTLEGDLISKEKNIFLFIKDRINSFDAKVRRINLTDYYGSKKSGTSQSGKPFLVKLTDGCFIVMWEEYLNSEYEDQYDEYTRTHYEQIDNGVKYVYIDENGNKLSDINYLPNAKLDYNCQPVLVNDKLVWYSNENDKRKFYLLELDYSIIPITPETHNPMCGDDITWTLDDNGTLTITGEGDMYDFYYTNYWEDYQDKIKNVIIGEGITHIGSGAFAGFRHLENISFPKTVNSVSMDVITYTPFIENELNWEGSLFYKDNILLSRKTEDEFDSDNLKYNIKSGTRVLAYYIFNGSKAEDIYIPESVENIGIGAFSQCYKLKKCVLPPHIKTIGASAFENCESLEQIIIPNGVQTIEYRTFAECSSLQSIELPNSVTAIHAESFSNCRALKDIYYTGTEEEWNNIRIFDEDMIEDVFIYLANATIHYNSHMPYTPPSVSTDYKVSGNKAIFTVTSLDGRLAELPYSKLYLAEYDTDGQLINIKTGINSKVEDNKITITSDIPQTSNYKFMLWGRNNSPLIQPITDIR